MLELQNISYSYQPGKSVLNNITPPSAQAVSMP